MMPSPTGRKVLAGFAIAAALLVASRWFWGW